MNVAANMSIAAKVLARCVDALPDAAFALDGDWRLSCANRAARLLFPGMREGEPVSRTVRAPEIFDALRAALQVSARDVVRGGMTGGQIGEALQAARVAAVRERRRADS